MSAGTYFFFFVNKRNWIELMCTILRVFSPRSYSYISVYVPISLRNSSGWRRTWDWNAVLAWLMISCLNFRLSRRQKQTRWIYWGVQIHRRSEAMNWQRWLTIESKNTWKRWSCLTRDLRLKKIRKENWKQKILGLWKRYSDFQSSSRID